VNSDDVSEQAIKMIAAAPKPFFLWLHYFDPHFSYISHSDINFTEEDYDGPIPSTITQQGLYALKRTGKLTSTDIDHIKAIYDGEIAFTDRAIGKVTESVSAAGMDDEVVYLVTGDHGEAFRERGRFFHGRDVYNEIVHVPLIIGGAIRKDLIGQSFAAPVETRNLPATVMVLAGVSEHSFRGQDLLEVAATGEAAPFVFSEGSTGKGEGTIKVGVVGYGWKLIHNFDDDRYELYDLTSDPIEKENRIEEDASETNRMRGLLREALDGLTLEPYGATSKVEITEDEKAHLRELGYVE
jgi:arylsulfatase A-like enzyme